MEEQEVLASLHELEPVVKCLLVLLLGCTVWIEVAECHVVVVYVDQAPMRVLDDSGAHNAVAGQITLFQIAIGGEDDARC